jgi:hypothetical protein
MSAKRKLLKTSVVVGGGLLATGLIAGVAIGYLSSSGADMVVNTAAFWIVVAIAVAAMVAALWFSFLWMRSIDEAAREAHKWAWYWGGSSGMAAGGVLIMLAALPQAAQVSIPNWFIERADPAAYAATGAFGMLSLMIIGYLIAWGCWWLARR